MLIETTLPEWLIHDLEDAQAHDVSHVEVAFRHGVPVGLELKIHRGPPTRSGTRNRICPAPS